MALVLHPSDKNVMYLIISPTKKKAKCKWLHVGHNQQWDAVILLQPREENWRRRLSSKYREKNKKKKQGQEDTHETVVAGSMREGEEDGSGC